MIFEEKKIGDYGNIVSFLLYLEVSDALPSLIRVIFMLLYERSDIYDYIFVNWTYGADINYS